MNHYKLREGESIRKPVVKRDRIEIHVPVLLLCVALAALIWLYVVGLSKINRESLSEADSTPVTEQETGLSADADPFTAPVTFALGADRLF